MPALEIAVMCTTGTVVPGALLARVTLAFSCLASASTMLVPRPALAGAEPAGTPTPSSPTEKVQSPPLAW